MDYNYHTHTWRCSHATGTMREYVERAIEGGIRYMGFSDHAPLRFEDGYESSYRVPFADAKAYCEDVAALQEEFQGKIELKAGFEMEYYPERFETMVRDVVAAGGEYLILGAHFLEPEYPVRPQHSMFQTESVEALQNFVKNLVAAMHTGVFTYIAHPDGIYFVGDAETYREEVRKICIAARETETPLEINCLGIRDHRFYPNEAFWAVAGEEQAPVTFGFDAHDALSAFDGESLKKAQEIVAKYRLNYIGRPKLVLLQEKFR